MLFMQEKRLRISLWRSKYICCANQGITTPVSYVPKVSPTIHQSCHEYTQHFAG